LKGRSVAVEAGHPTAVASFEVCCRFLSAAWVACEANLASALKGVKTAPFGRTFPSEKLRSRQRQPQLAALDFGLPIRV